MTAHYIDLRNALVSGIAGTTAMTAFSYLVSQKQEKYFKEPEILNDLLYRLLGGAKRNRKSLPGFLGHYATGILFSTVYNVFAKKMRPLPSTAGGLASGLAFGLLGIGIWKTVFSLHPRPPKIDLNSFLGHLIVAHVIFGETVAVTTAFFRKMPSRIRNVSRCTVSGDIKPGNS
ncbi:MAG TPA: hypothetical protein VF490_18895 [Chryseosolibacter sp.]